MEITLEGLQSQINGLQKEVGLLKEGVDTRMVAEPETVSFYCESCGYDRFEIIQRNGVEYTRCFTCHYLHKNGINIKETKDNDSEFCTTGKLYSGNLRCGCGNDLYIKRYKAGRAAPCVLYLECSKCGEKVQPRSAASSGGGYASNYEIDIQCNSESYRQHRRDGHIMYDGDWFDLRTGTRLTDRYNFKDTGYPNVKSFYERRMAQESILK